MFTNTESLSKTKHNLTFRMGRKLSSKLLFRSSPNTGFYTFYISQGSVATQLRCGGMFSNHFTTNFSHNAAVKKFRKSINIRQRYGQNFVAYFFGPPGISTMIPLSLLCDCSVDHSKGPYWLIICIQTLTRASTVYCIRLNKTIQPQIVNRRVHTL